MKFEQTYFGKALKSGRIVREDYTKIYNMFNECAENFNFIIKHTVDPRKYLVRRKLLHYYYNALIRNLHKESHIKPHLHYTIKLFRDLRNRKLKGLMK